MLEIIEKSIFKGFKENIKGNTFSLVENGAEAKCKKAVFKKTGKIIVYKFDKTPLSNGIELRDKFPFFNDIPGLKAMCDYILFYKKEGINRLFVVLCNMKSGNTSNSAAQFDAGKTFTNFILENVKRISQSTNENSQVTFYKVLFSSKILYKESTNPRHYNPSIPKNFLSNDTTTSTCDLDNLCRH